MKIIQLSDLHLTGGVLYGTDPHARLQMAIDSIMRDHQDGSFCLLSGDLADAGADADYAALATATARLPMPVYPMPGNHDDRNALRRAFPRLPVDEQGFIQYAVDTPQGRFLLLDTLDAGNPWGLYCEQREAWLRRQLADESAKAFFIVMHHPPLAVGIPSMDQYALRDAGAFYALLAPFRQKIRHLFFGHLHRPIGGSWHGIPFSVVRSPNHQVALDQQPRSGVLGCHEAPGYGVVLIDDASVVVHQQNFLDTGPRFIL